MKLSWFVNALGWTWPAAHRLGMAYNIDGVTPGDMLTLPKHIVGVGRIVGMSEEAWACLRTTPAPLHAAVCESSFYSAWAGEPERTFSTAVALHSCLAALLLLLAATVTRSLVVGALASVVVGLAAGSATLVGYRLWEYVEYIGAEGMEVKLSSGFLLIVWGAVLSSLAANLATLWAQRVGRPPKSWPWMDDEARREIEALVDEVLAGGYAVDAEDLDEDIGGPLGDKLESEVEVERDLERQEKLVDVD